MTTWRRFRYWPLAALPAALVCFPLQAASAWQMSAAGGRFGFSSEGGTRDFTQTEAALELLLPWHKTSDSGWQIETRLDFSAGILHARDDQAAIWTLGPSVQIGRGGFPLVLDLGVSPTVLASDRVGGRDFGRHIQFTSHAGLLWDIHGMVRLGYRYQHMSNASLGDHNPGLNLHMFTVGFRF